MMYISHSKESIAGYERITHAAQPYFAQMPPKWIRSLEDHYPKTCSLLFETALQVASKDQEGIFADTLSDQQIVELLQVEEKPSEIFVNQQLRRDIAPKDLAALLQRFRENLANLQTPSYLTVQALLDNGKINLACDTAHTLTHRYDNTKALTLLIKYFVHANDLQKAISLFRMLPEEEDIRDIAALIALSLLKTHQQDDALQFAHTLTPLSLKDHTLHIIALWVARNDRLQQALDITATNITNKEMKAYTCSLIATILASDNKFTDAQQLAKTIYDKEYRQDAYHAIIKKMALSQCFDAACQFIDELSDPLEQHHLHQIIESVKKILAQNEMIRKIYRLAQS